MTGSDSVCPDTKLKGEALSHQVPQITPRSRITTITKITHKYEEGVLPTTNNEPNATVLKVTDPTFRVNRALFYKYLHFSSRTRIKRQVRLYI